MSQLPISRPLLVFLLLAMVISAVVVLRPAAVAVSPETDLLAERPVLKTAGKANDDASPWLRSFATVKATAVGHGGLMPPKPAVLPPPPPVMPVIVVPPPKPVAPTPEFTYLGRLDTGEEVTIFLSVGDTFESVRLGDMIDSTWRLKRITDGGVELEYLPLHEIRWLALTR